jgi:hypothetical protein
VIAIGTASVAHQIPIHTKMAAALWASIDKFSGLGNNTTNRAPSMPRKNPIFLFLPRIFSYLIVYDANSILH